MPPTPALTISRDQARRFLVRRHLLAPPRSLPARPGSVLKVIERLGLLQFDPIDVPGARSHDIALHARIAGYQRGWCEHWLYGKDRRLIELYNKSLNIVPISELAHYRVTWQLYAPRMGAGILREQKSVANAMLARIKAEGPLSTTAFDDHKQVVDWWWAPTRVGRAVLEGLFVTGRLGIARRDGNRRYYDLTERLVPAERLAERAPMDAGRRHRFLSLFRAAGMTSPTGGGLGEAIYRVGKATDRARWMKELVDEGVLQPITIEGLAGTFYILAQERSLLNAAKPADRQPLGVSFVAPLDSLIWDRRLLRELWGFDYLWEIYLPEAKRKWGYYVLPILYGDRFVGRIEPHFERTTRTLRIVGIAFEDRALATKDPRFPRALAEAVEAYRLFVGAERLSWPPDRIGRDLAAAVRRLA